MNDCQKLGKQVVRHPDPQHGSEKGHLSTALSKRPVRGQSSLPQEERCPDPSPKPVPQWPGMYTSVSCLESPPWDLCICSQSWYLYPFLRVWGTLSPFWTLSPIPGSNFHGVLLCNYRTKTQMESLSFPTSGTWGTAIEGMANALGLVQRLFARATNK